MCVVHQERRQSLLTNFAAYNSIGHKFPSASCWEWWWKYLLHL